MTAREVAEQNGFHPNRSGFICCPFHHEKTASLKLYPNGSWHCFGCNRGGSSIDFAAALHGLTPLDAVRQLNDDFHLGLPIDRQQTPQERTEAAKRREVADAHEQFETWRSDFLAQLNAAFRVAHGALQKVHAPEDWDKLPTSETTAIQFQPVFEHWADTLTSGTMAEQIQIFRERRDILRRIEQILNRTPRKSGAA